MLSLLKNNFVISGIVSLILVGFIASQEKNIGLRVPEHAAAMGLLEAMGEPLLSTTLKLPDFHEDEAMLRDPEDIAAALDKRVAVVLGCGAGSDDVSTIVDFTADEPRITRQGAGELR